MNDNDKNDDAMDVEELRQMLEDLIEQFEHGDVKSAALRLFLTDGTQEDIVIGDTEVERAQILSSLRRRLGELH